MPSQYGYAVDIWSVGCIFAELLLRTPYLAGESDLAQLELIFKALGTPTEEDWPVFIYFYVSLVRILMYFNFLKSFYHFFLRAFPNWLEI